MADFFRQQEQARGRTRTLLFLFALSVAAVIGLIYFLSGLITLWGADVWAPSLALSAIIGGGIIGLGSGVKMLQLSAGGSAVARDLGGRELDTSTTDPDERKLLNIVEEMSIASGIPVPQVWVMDQEDGINAFAAGKSTSDAVVGVTRGCMRALNRDELQGVIAHEFSHILNGDMRLNLRLIGVVHGILVIAIVGGAACRIAASMRGDGKNSPQIPIFIAGGLLYAIGYAGVLMGRLIKSAVSRQREFLADASAVQFTRNPYGIAGALMKIGGLSSGSRLRSPNAEEASHMMFSSVLSRMASLFATHPPLQERIRAILPDWKGDFEHVPAVEINAAPRRPQPVARAQMPAAAAAVSMLTATPQEVVARVGMVSPADMDNAVRLREGIPQEMLELLRDSGGAQAVVCGLLISADESEESTTLARLVDGQTLHTARAVASMVEAWHSTHAIAVIDLAIPALRRLTLEEYRRFSAILDELIATDHHVDLFEFMVQRVLRRHLDRWFQKTQPPGIQFRKFGQLMPELETVLTAVCGVGQRTAEEGLASLQSGQAVLAGLGVDVSLQPRPATLEQVSAALDRFDAATPLLKKQLLTACVAVASHDGVILDQEAELLRAIADTVGCPMPPLNVA